jgi:hypothetical protein
MRQNIIKPYLYFNEKTLINGGKYTLNIKSDNLFANSIIATNIKVLQDISFDNSTIKNIDTNIIYIPDLQDKSIRNNRFIIAGFINAIDTKDNIINIFQNNPEYKFEQYFFNFIYENNCVFNSLNNILMKSLNNANFTIDTTDLYPFFDPSTYNDTNWVVNETIYDKYGELSPVNFKINTNIPILETDFLPVNPSEYISEITFGNTGIFLLNQSDLYFENNDNTLSDIKLSYQGNINIKDISTINLSFETVSIIDKNTGLSADKAIQIDPITQNFKISNIYGDNSIEFLNDDIIFNGDLVIYLNNTYKSDLNMSNMLNIYLNNTILDVTSEIFINNL